MKAIKMILLAGFLVLPITSQAKGKPVDIPPVHEDCSFDWETACLSDLTAVDVAISAATFIDPKADSNRSNLEAKQDAAEAKLSCGKLSDAMDKLLDISDKATAWADAPKPKLEDATGINEAVGDAITCIPGL